MADLQSATLAWTEKLGDHMCSRTGIIALNLGLFSVAACSDGGKNGGGTADAGTGGTLTVATYNLGLLGSVGFVEERAPLATAAAAGLEADVLCVQEVWEQAHWDTLVAANEQTRPHTLRLAAEPGVMGKCAPDQFNPLQACAEPACGGSASLVTCVLSACGEYVAPLGTGCTDCLLQNAPSGDFAAIRAACVGTGMAQGTPAPEDRSYVSGGSYGIGLLSAKPFAATDEKRLDASTVRRGILYGRLDDTPIGTVHVFCTHLAAILPGLAYEGSYGDFVGENAAHADALIAWAEEKAGKDGKVILLGDFNSGPAQGDIEASVPENYAKFPKAGFDDAFLAGANAACTFCSSNPLVLSGDTAINADIDHILTRGIDEPISAERVLDELVTIDAPGPDGGAGTEQREVGLSDHFGLRASIGD
jgi:endonuclease/exonuclease/phosphatase family metal-dependent hydrolase